MLLNSIAIDLLSLNKSLHPYQKSLQTTLFTVSNRTPFNSDLDTNITSKSAFPQYSEKLIIMNTFHVQANSICTVTKQKYTYRGSSPNLQKHRSGEVAICKTNTVAHVPKHHLYNPSQ